MDLNGPPLQSRARGWRRACAAVGIFLSFFSVYLLSMSRERPWADATPIYLVAENLVRDGSFATNVRWPPDSPVGRDGKYYCYAPLLASLLHLPGAALRHAVTLRWPKLPAGATEVDPDRAALEVLSWPWAAHVGPAAAGALVCVLFFGLCRQHRFSRLSATLGTLTVGLGSSVWVYARYPYSEILQTACFLGYLLTALRLWHDPRPRWAALLGVWAGLLLNTKFVFAPALIGPALLIAWSLRRDPRRLATTAVVAALAFAPWVALVLYYNWIRFNSIWNTGYNAYSAEFFGRGRLWIGLFGLFLSPGKSLFLYSPPLLIGLFGGGRYLWRHHRRTVVLLFVTAAPVVFTYARFAFWHGDWAWGPRYLTFLVPPLLLFFAAFLERLREAGRRRWVALVFGIAIGTGAFVQVLGNAFYWDHWIRVVAHDVRAKWLGNPNRAGAISPDRGGICDACIEDLYPLHYLPQFQPIRGHWWLLKHVPFDHDWQTAARDAPWQPDTNLLIDTSRTYIRARVDWWLLDYRDHDRAATLLLSGLLMILATGLCLWLVGLRKGRSRPLRSERALDAPAAPPGGS